MDRFFAYLGALIGSIFLSMITFPSFLSILDTFFHIISFISTLVFSVAFVWEGLKYLFKSNA